MAAIALVVVVLIAVAAFGLLAINIAVGNTAGVIGCCVFIAVLAFSLWSSMRPGPRDPR